MIREIYFEDHKSRGNQHLSGNASLIKQFSDCIFDKNVSLYICAGDAYANRLINYCRGLGVELRIRNSRRQKIKNSLTVVLYPEYGRWMKYLFSRIRHRRTICVAHGHLNSFNGAGGGAYLLEALKYAFFGVFEKIVVYSHHIEKGMGSCTRRGPLSFKRRIHKKIRVITEVIALEDDQKLKSRETKAENDVVIGYFRDSRNDWKVLGGINGNEEVTVLELARAGTSQGEYFRLLSSVDILLLPKMWHTYAFQVSGVINDCIALGIGMVGIDCNKYLLSLRDKLESITIIDSDKLNIHAVWQAIKIWRPKGRKYYSQQSMEYNLKCLEENKSIILGLIGL
jgi:hypothetical protein